MPRSSGMIDFNLFLNSPAIPTPYAVLPRHEEV